MTAKDDLADFRNFLYLCWKHLNLPDPTEIQYDIAYYLQHGPDRIIIEAFRGVGKSWITAAFVCWLLLRNPQLNILVISASKARSDDFSTFTMLLIETMPMLQHLSPREGQRASKISFDVAPAEPDQAPSVKSLGITSQIAGSRADVVIGDDVEVPNNSSTQMMRDKLSEQVKEFDAVMKPGGRIVMLGTPQNEQTLYNKMAARGFAVRIWPARYPGEKELTLYGNRLAPSIGARLASVPSLAGHPTDPRRFTNDDLLAREISYGKVGFAMQFMLLTNLADLERYPLKVRDLVVMHLNPDVAPQKVVWSADKDLVIDDLPNSAMAGDFFHKPFQLIGGDFIPYTGSIMTIDPSGRGKDETGYAVTKMLHGQIFCTAWGGFSGGYTEDTLAALAKIARDQKVNLIRVEDNFGDGMWTALFKPVLARFHNVFIDEVHSTGQKELRIIDTLEPVMAQHKLIMDRDVLQKDYDSVQSLGVENPFQYQGIYQMTRITRDRGALAHDDRLEALAMGVAYWVEQLSKDVDEAVREQKDQCLQDALDKFMGHVLGSKPKQHVWMTT